MKYFGTDGIRGVYPEKLSDELAFRVGRSLTTKKYINVIVARDTRVSGASIAKDLCYGLSLGGANITYVGIASTPCLAFLCEKFCFDYGIMITASHNPKQYNGIKIFNSVGEKLPYDEEKRLEKSIDKIVVDDIIKSNIQKLNLLETFNGQEIHNLDERVNPRLISFKPKLVDYYIEEITQEFRFKNKFKVGIDTANGGASDLAEKIFKKVGVSCTVINKSLFEDINDNCGALYPQKMRQLVVDKNLDIGICLDGDADRLVVVQDDGTLLNGDDLIYLLSLYLKSKNRLAKNTVVLTILNNLALENELKENDIKVVRCDVGDKNIYEEIKTKHYNFGGENCGHIIFGDKERSGDGIYCALKLLQMLDRLDAKISSLPKLKLKNEVSINYDCQDKNRLIKNQSVLELKQKLEEQIKKDGRIILRASGTENKVRIMVEHSSLTKAKQVANKLLRELEKQDK